MKQNSLLENFHYRCTLVGMQRVSATLLIVLFSFSLIGPAVFASDEDSKLPACCRRAGHHHCAMQSSQSESSPGPALRTGRCPIFPVTRTVPANRTIGLLGTFTTVRAGLVSHPASGPQAEAICRISYSRAGQKRGPPSPLS